MDASERFGAATRAARFEPNPSLSQEAHHTIRRIRTAPTAAANAPATPSDPPDLRVVEMIEALRRRIASRPMSATILALGFGFVLGGALSFRAGRAALGIAGRHVVRELLKEML